MTFSTGIYIIIIIYIKHEADIKKEGMQMRFIIEHLSKHYEKKEVLRNIDFTFERFLKN